MGFVFIGTSETLRHHGSVRQANRTHGGRDM